MRRNLLTYSNLDDFVKKCYDDLGGDAYEILRI